MAGTDGVAEKWRELSGENNWVGLLDPLDIDLRRYIIHYGERTAAVGDAYTDETVVSKRNRPEEAYIENQVLGLLTKAVD
ncbi:hypothetical protein LWI28_014951 [Acer negundo]|uniref:Phospholipase A1 n=1 Tax=Acer negundo TaxID=4023 RepID=A0AAD5JPE4_ACENE|nr:hypothetical protein LWI28_014951 [Acer negundo]